MPQKNEEIIGKSKTTIRSKQAWILIRVLQNKQLFQILLKKPIVNIVFKISKVSYVFMSKGLFNLANNQHMVYFRGLI